MSSLTGYNSRHLDVIDYALPLPTKVKIWTGKMKTFLSNQPDFFFSFVLFQCIPVRGCRITSPYLKAFGFEEVLNQMPFQIQSCDGREERKESFFAFPTPCEDEAKGRTNSIPVCIELSLQVSSMSCRLPSSLSPPLLSMMPFFFF